MDPGSSGRVPLIQVRLLVFDTKECLQPDKRRSFDNLVPFRRPQRDLAADWLAQRKFVFAKRNVRRSSGFVGNPCLINLGVCRRRRLEKFLAPQPG